MNKFIAFFVMSLMTFISYGADNKLYIDQTGDTLSATIVQDGGGNTIGTSLTDFTLKGDTMTFNVDQTGSTNTLDRKSVV